MMIVPGHPGVIPALQLYEVTAGRPQVINNMESPCIGSPQSIPPYDLL